MIGDPLPAAPVSPVSPDSDLLKEAVGLLRKVHQMATEGHVKAGCDNWRAVERCRQIANLTARAAHTGEG